MEIFLQMNTLSGKSHGRIRKAYCLSSAVHHLDFALLHLDGGRSPYMNRNLLSMECKHSKPTISYSCTAHFSTKIVPTSKKRARKCPFYRLLRAFENYSNFSLQSCCVVFFVDFDGRNQGVLSDFYLLCRFSRDCIVILLSLIFHFLCI